MASSWAGTTGSLGEYIKSESRRTLSAYRKQPTLVAEHANLEIGTAGGGYADRQLVELIQNSADALAGPAVGERGRISIRLTDDCLYCADNGDEMDEDGARALMFSHLSPKRRESEIGRFGLGFKAVLGVSDAPEFYSRSGSFRFDRGKTADRIRKIVPDHETYPALRLATPIDPRVAARGNRILAEEMVWARNIVRLPLLAGARSRLEEQMRSFPTPFLLFVEHVRSLSLSGHREDEVTCEVVERRADGECVLRVDDEEQKWIVFRRRHRLSEEAIAEWALIRDRAVVPLSWAFPQDARQRDEHRHFWAYFRTGTESLVPGILNAPWKTNEDRQNLLPGAFNRDLLQASADLIVRELGSLRTADDPARHLDALPRRQESGDSEQSKELRVSLISQLRHDAVVPDQTGTLRPIERLQYPPKDAPLAALERWAECETRPADWLHVRAASRDRIATIGRLWRYHRANPEARVGDLSSSVRGPSGASDADLPRESAEDWLEALFSPGLDEEQAARASRVAVQTAALLPAGRHDGARHDLGEIVLTAAGGRARLDPAAVFVPRRGTDDGTQVSAELLVHPRVAEDEKTRAALEKLGLGEPPAEAALRAAVREITEAPGDSAHRKFWSCVRESLAKDGPDAVAAILDENEFALRQVRIRTESGAWEPAHSVLLPGRIARAGVSDDSDVTVDIDYHRSELPFLTHFGVVEAPELRDLGLESLVNYRAECVERFRSDCKGEGGRVPMSNRLRFESTEGVGPLSVLSRLSHEGRALYTEAMLGLEATYAPWTMAHDAGGYPPRTFRSPSLREIERHGRLRARGGSVPFQDALGEPPKSEEALRFLLEHSQAARIRRVFRLANLTPEFFGEGEPEPLFDVWPGLQEHLPDAWKDSDLRPCERIVGLDDRPCATYRGDVYLVRTGDDSDDLKAVAEELNLDLRDDQVEDIANRTTPQEVAARRAAVRALPSEAERLLRAVGEAGLRARLPGSLVAHLSGRSEEISGVRIAEAAIAVFQTDTLHEYRRSLAKFAPPRKWAGSTKAVEFVESLGFPPDWAGEPGGKREPYIEVEGRFRLEPLHDYQQQIVAAVRAMSNSTSEGPTERRGMLSLPTGAGKTRIAVQSLVEALVDGQLCGPILWVADRDELCEQAVESWRQIWSAKGKPGTVLRVSRLWGGQRAPGTARDLHVVVATIQTLRSRLSRQTLRPDFQLVVVDEAHRTLAQSFTLVLAALGLKHRRKPDEPFLLGLTATPYRGYDEDETKRLVNRYGKNRLDRGVFGAADSQGVVVALQQQRILALADQMTIEGTRLEMTAEERRKMDRAPHWLPEQVERRIGQDLERTERIVDAFVSRRKAAGPTLIFATSVEHAHTVSALLNLRRVRSRAVSGNTNRGTRRRIVEEFRAEEIEVLVNYGVFREGFDAPKTRTIIVARPVYSPNLYFQMIGRGLRGEKNGGNERCLILNVADNIVNFRRKLAFSELDWLWAAGA